MGKKAKTPQAPDYTALANQQAQQGQEAWNAALQAGRVDQSNPFGKLDWNQDPTTGQWSQNVSLNQPQQDIFNQQQANQQQLANMGGSMLGGFNTSQIDLSKAPGLPGVADYSSLGKIPGAVDYSSLGAIPQVGQYDQRATDLFRQLGQPDLDRAQAARRASLAARGISDVTSQAGTNMEAQLADQTNRFGLGAAQAGINQGNIMFGQGMQAYGQGAQNLNNQFAQNMAGYQQGAQNLNNQFTQGMGLNQQGVSNILAERQANLGQLSGLMGLGQNMGTPQFNTVQTPQPYNTANLMGAAGQQYQAQVDAANAKRASSPWGTIGGLLGGAAGSFLGPAGTAFGTSAGKSIFGG